MREKYIEISRVKETEFFEVEGYEMQVSQELLTQKGYVLANKIVRDGTYVLKEEIVLLLCLTL